MRILRTRFFILTATLGMLAIVLIGAFQNCSGVHLVPRTVSASIEVLQQQKVAEFCAPPSIETYLPQKYVFVVDMSASNLGTKVATPVYGRDGSWFGDDYEFQSCPPQDAAELGLTPAQCPPATDPTSARFTAIKNFLTTCQQAQSGSSKFGLIGFSRNFVKPKGFTGRTCSDLLTDRSIFSNEVDGLKGQQDFAQQYSPFGSLGKLRSRVDPFLMDSTSYLSALTCMHDRLYEDINPNDNLTDYKVFFITDGRTSDSAQDTAKYLGVMQDLNSVLQTYHYRMKFQPVYYGPDSEYASAKTTLDSISTVANALSSFRETIRLDPTDPNFANVLSQNLCPANEPSTDVPFEVQGYYAISLTVHQVGDHMVVDSDADGVPDDSELAMGFDATKSHTGLVLDGLCISDRTKCQAFQQKTPSCDPTKAVGYGFNECDKLFANSILGGQALVRPFTGIDYDGDDVLDYVEIIKGKNPFVQDLTSNPDADDKDTKGEILRGTDPFSSTSKEIVDKYGLQFQFSAGAPGCATDNSYTVYGQRFPVGQTLAVAAESFTAHNHEAEENLVLLVYSVHPVAYHSNETHVFARVVKVKGKQHYSVSDLIRVGVIP